MRIGLVIYGSLETVSGGYLYDRKLVDYLRRQGDRVEIVSLPWHNYAWHLIQNLSRDYLHQIATLKVDVLLQDELNHPSLFWLNNRVRPTQPAKIISIVHHLRASEQHPARLKPIYRLVERLYLQGVDGLVFNSQTTRQVVEKLIGAKKPWVVAMPGGNRFGSVFDEMMIIEKYRQAKQLRLLFVGNLIARKGLHVLLTGLAQLKDLEWSLRIVGRPVDMEYQQQLIRQCKRLDLNERVDWLGGLDEAALQQEFEQAHLITVPSLYEGFGIIYLEGMAFGLPSLATTAGAAGEIITHGVNGLLVPPEDAQALALALRPWLADREALIRASLAARQRFLEFPSWEQSMQNIRNFLLQEINKSHGD